MARPRKTERRDRQFNLKLTTPEFNWLRVRAKAVRMQPVDFARAQLFSTRRKRQQPSEGSGKLAPLFIAQLSRIGNNLNQLARRFHQFQIPAPRILDEVLQEVRALIRGASGHGS